MLTTTDDDEDGDGDEDGDEEFVIGLMTVEFVLIFVVVLGVEELLITIIYLVIVELE